MVRAVAGTGVAIKDTRKTLPGLRALEKYAVAVGGGVNHRFGLYDAVLIKDNHIGVAGSITVAVDRVRARWAESFPVQVEVDTLAQLEEALTCRVNAVLLDNMTPEQLRSAVAIAGGRCHLEASGASRSRTCAPLPSRASIPSRSAGSRTRPVRWTSASTSSNGERLRRRGPPV